MKINLRKNRSSMVHRLIKILMAFFSPTQIYRCNANVNSFEINSMRSLSCVGLAEHGLSSSHFTLCPVDRVCVRRMSKSSFHQCVLLTTINYVSPRSHSIFAVLHLNSGRAQLTK